MKALNVHLDYTVRVIISDDDYESLAEDVQIEDRLIDEATDTVMRALSAHSSEERLNAVDRIILSDAYVEDVSDMFGYCDVCGRQYYTYDRHDHDPDCGTCWEHCVASPRHSAVNTDDARI